MINTQIYKSTTEVCPVTRVVEKTINPDKVTEMYDKVKDEVENNFVRKFIIQENNLHGIVAEHLENQLTRNKTIIIRFVLNGEEHIIKKIQDDKYIFDKNKAIRLLVESISSEIIKELIDGNNL